MSALVLILGTVSLETWGQNLDLTIPSLEMPSTLVLDSKDKREIMMGWTCCWASQHIDSVHQEASLKLIGLGSKGKQNSSPYTLHYDTDAYEWLLFYTVQALDVHSTIQGLKYSCIEEANPFLPSRPHRDHLMLHKAFLMFTVFRQDYWQIEQINMLTLFTSAVVIENRSITNKATCPLR